MLPLESSLQGMLDGLASPPAWRTPAGTMVESVIGVRLSEPCLVAAMRARCPANRDSDVLALWRSALKVLVALKRVLDPDNANKVRPTPNGEALDAAGLDWKINPFDEYALEAALRLTEDGRKPKARLGEVIVVTLGPPESETALRSALATGADRAVRVQAQDDALDGRLVALALARLAAEEQPDLVLLGKQTVDGDTNQVAQALGERLQWPTVTEAVRLRAEPTALRVARIVDGGTLTVRLQLPAVISIDLGIVAPKSVYSLHTPEAHRYTDGVRFAPLPAVIGAKRKPLAVLPLGDLVVQTEPTTRYLRFGAPSERPPGRRVASVDELVQLLASEAKVLGGGARG